MRRPGYARSGPLRSRAPVPSQTNVRSRCTLIFITENRVGGPRPETRAARNHIPAPKIRIVVFRPQKASTSGHLVAGRPPLLADGGS